MKHIIVLLLLILNSAFGLAQNAEFTFLNSSTHDWGKVDEGVQLKHYFVFENTSDIPLIIDDALVSCSCTKVTFPKEPILPNQRDSILVQFDTNQKYYKQDRVIRLSANTRRTTKLRIKVYVIPEDD